MVNRVRGRIVCPIGSMLQGIHQDPRRANDRRDGASLRRKATAQEALTMEKSMGRFRLRRREEGGEEIKQHFKVSPKS